MTRPSLLFISHFLPTWDGVGPNIRAAASVDALSAFFDVHVLHVEFYTIGVGNLRFVHERAASFTRLPARTGEVAITGLVARRWPDVTFSAIHTFRLLSARITLGILAQLPAPRPHLHLDLDDDECVREGRTIALMTAAGDGARAAHQQAELTRLSTLERMLAPRFDTLSLAGDPTTAQARFPRTPVLHLPNVVRLLDAPAVAPAAADKPGYDVLFCGSLNYFPNAEGVEYFCREVLPRLRARVQKPVRLTIVGANPDPRVQALASLDGVALHANVPEIAPYYRGVDLCVVPVRAGSGTRLKILDAFSRRCAVVSTRVGAEDLGVTAGVQLLLADDPDEMADACARVLSDLTLRQQLIEHAFAWLEANLTVNSLKPVLASVYAPVLAGVAARPPSSD
jgi:glycosyltransferase involved in cell wall biosynthesis